MNTCTGIPSLTTLLIVVWVCASLAEPPLEPPLMIGGCGGVYFLPQPGKLWVEVYKQDLNRRGSPTELRALLVGPDRSVLQEARLPDDGQGRGAGPGRLQSARLEADAPAVGVYALNITVSNDRYGREMVWGFRTNCRRYLIETARGHKDERHQEPLVLMSPDRPVDVAFLPRKQRLAFEITGLPSGADRVAVLDGAGETMVSVPVKKDHSAAGAVAASPAREHIPWRLHLPAGRAVVNLDGVTRWSREDVLPDSALWTPNANSWFPLHEHRWLLTPYSRRVYAQPGESKQVSFRLHNNARRPMTLRLSIEYPGKPWDVRLARDQATLKPGQTESVTVACQAPAGGQRACRLRVQPDDGSDFTTYSTLTVIAGTSPASRPLSIPLLLKPYQHENEQVGYLPDYPLDWEPYFAPDNTPFIRLDRGLRFRQGKRWRDADCRDIPASAGRSNTKVAFDTDGDVYLVTAANRAAWLLHSTDHGRTFHPHKLGRRGGFDIENFTGHNTPHAPPPLVRSVTTARDPKLRWRILSTLELIVPEKRDGAVVIGEPVVLSRKSLGVGAHSGVPAAICSRGDRIHIIWAEATAPEERVPGVPTYVVTYDRSQRRLLGDPVLVGYGAPPNDVHNRPCLVMDGQGYLHALTGTHGQPFQYARSLQPNTAHSGWTKAETVGAGLSQTYIGMVCGPDGTLHIAFRLWQRGKEPHPLATHATLAYQRKLPGKPWEPPRVMVVAPFSEYSIFYHRLTIDRRGRLFLSYDYWSTYWFYRNDHFGSRRALMMSADGGDTWKLVEDDDFAAGAQ